MHIFTNEVTDWVIAENADDANAVLCEQYCYTLAELMAEHLEVTEMWPDDKPLRIAQDGEIGPQAWELLPEQWIAREGRGFLCSTEH